MLTAVHCVDGGESDVEAQVGPGIVNAVEAEADGCHDCHGVFPAVDEVRKHVPCVVVTPDALEGAPYRRESEEKAKKSRVG